MKAIKYCKSCLMPSTKPYISFDRMGICSACKSAEKKRSSVNGVDWEARERAFEELILWAKKQNAPFYDAMVPVSGGKDSITQVHRLLNRGLRILAVNVDYGIKTEIGRSNLECVPAMGANLLVFRPELRLHKRLIKIGLEEYGDPDLLSHTLLHAYPLHVAKQFQIPLCLLGENSALEYSGDEDLGAKNEITRHWFNSYAANKGMTAKVVAKKYGIPFENLWQYDFPDDLEKNSRIKAVFCSGYFQWDSNEHLRIAKSYDFRELSEPSEGTYRKFVGIDEKINRLHQYLKVLKFGYGRATDHACEDIRLGVLKREQGKELIRLYDLQPLSETVIGDVCDFLEYDVKTFSDVIESYRNKDIWTQNDQLEWIIPGHLED